MTTNMTTNMNNKEDLRSRHTGPGSLGIILRELAKVPPMVFESETKDTSGLDCMVQLVRHANRLAIYRQGLLPGEDANPIVAYSWRNFDSARTDMRLRDERMEDKRRLVEILEEQGLDLSFECLASSTLMNGTLWSSPSWVLPLLKLEWNNGWHRVDFSTRAEESKASLLCFNCISDTERDLQAFINETFLADPPPRRPRTKILADSPMFVRVCYQSHAERPWSIEKLRTFTIPTPCLTDDGQWYRIGYDGELYYELTAVVRLRRHPGERDYIRTFHPGGQWVGIVSPPASYMSEDWSLSDLGSHEYMMVYSYTPVTSMTQSWPETLDSNSIKVGPFLPGFKNMIELSKQLLGSISTAHSSNQADSTRGVANKNPVASAVKSPPPARDLSQFECPSGSAGSERQFPRLFRTGPVSQVNTTAESSQRIPYIHPTVDESRTADQVNLAPSTHRRRQRARRKRISTRIPEDV